jgi:phage terminase large subunit-like protein
MDNKPVESIANMDFTLLSREAKLELLSSLTEFSDRVSSNKISYIFPETGPFSRDKYKKHMRFLEAGASFRQRLLAGGNRAGKTVVGGFEMAYHLIGDYPEWWKGRRFDSPVNAWACGVNNGRVRDTLQEVLLGKYGEIGTGLIPKDKIIDVSTKPGVPKGILDIWVMHTSGYTSHLIFKSYEEGREAYQGTAQDVVWFDEEPPEDIYLESLMRLVTTDGILYCTFTPLMGFTGMVLRFLPGGLFPYEDQMKASKMFVERIEWDDVPHIDEKTKREMEAAYLPHEREARMRGFPTISEGKIYPVSESDFVINPIDILAEWPRVYGLDVGYRCTAAVFGAYNPKEDVWYIYNEYKKELDNPVNHAAVLRKMSGKWIPGVIDPSSAGAGKQHDGYSLLEAYRDEDLDVFPANNSVEIGIREIYGRLGTGGIKVFSNCQAFLNEFRIYRYDKHGKPVKSNDHLMDAFRYLIMSGPDVARTDPKLEEDENQTSNFNDWAGRNNVTGY